MPSKCIKLKCVILTALILILIYLSGMVIKREIIAWFPLFSNQNAPDLNLLPPSVDHDTSEASNRRDDEGQMASVLHRLRTRAQRLTRSCQHDPFMSSAIPEGDLKTTSMEKMMHVNRKHKLLYWAIPKIGSSFWKRIFKVLDSSNNAAIKMFEMTNMDAHKRVPKTIMFSEYKASDRAQMLETFTKFYFVRDPYARLFSAYLDKLLIPTTVGLYLTQDMVSSGFLTKDSCAWNVSFAELCRYVSVTILDWGGLDVHFAPISYHHPCRFHVTMLGKMETFAEDSRALLDYSNVSITDIAGDISDLDTENEIGYIKDISLRTIEFLISRDLGCLSQLRALRRLWTVFQVRGYILKTLLFPFSTKQEPETVLKEFSSAATAAYKQSGSPEVRHKQREEAMLEAYASLPEETLEKLEKSMEWDCSLFDYPCNIRERVRSYKAMGEIVFYSDMWATR